MCLADANDKRINAGKVCGNKTSLCILKYLFRHHKGRNTKLAIVLLQKNAPLPPGEDVVSSERISNLASVCDINQKMIFVLPYNDHLTGEQFNSYSFSAQCLYRVLLR